MVNGRFCVMREHVAAGKILEHDVVKCSAGEIDRGAVTRRFITFG